MNPPSPPKGPARAPISAHKLARFCKAVKLWLMRGAGWLVQVAGASAPLQRDVLSAIRPFISTMWRVVYALLMLKAMVQCETLPAQAEAPPPAPRQAVNRRALVRAPAKKRPRVSHDPRALIAAMLMLLQNIEAHAKRLARRLRKGAVRRIGRFELEPRAPLHNVLAMLTPACRDTS